MEKSLFIETRNQVFVENKQKQQTQNSTGNPKFNWIFILLILCLSGIAYFIYHQPKTKSENQTIQIQNSQKLETLIQKAVNDEELTETEWSELCQLLSIEKSLNINDCENCRVYIRAILGGKHENWLRLYMQKPDKEILRGIKSIEKQIILHQNKIKDPEKYCPDWNDIPPLQKENLINKKWNEDIKRQQEQKQLLECILKHRKL